MKFTELRRLAPLALVPTIACDSASERESTLGDVVEPAKAEARAPAMGPEGALAGAVPEGGLGNYLSERARILSHEPYAPSRTSLPAALDRLDYDAYRGIRFRPERALWKGESAFEVQLFHPGFVYKDAVPINVVEDGVVTRLAYDAGLFTFDGSAASASEAGPPDLGYAGFRIHHPLNRPDVFDEAVVFLGTSYFRLLGPGHVYGLSSRGLAVDIASDGDEEFPAFREFWLEAPEADARELVLHALLDGPSVTGAYRFVLRPGDATTMDVDATIFARQDVGKLGVAPMSSMFLYGENRPADYDDFRPEVHDSDGLMAHTGRGEWIWRPLTNGPGLQVTSLRDQNPRGFGLVQRERDFDRYLDLEAGYHRRPSEWVEVIDGDWGSGGVELLVIPTESEFNDNIAAYWVPDVPMRVGDERSFRYRVVMFDDRLGDQTLAQVERTRVGRAGLPGEVEARALTRRRVVVDFTGSDSALDGAHIEPFAETTAGEISGLAVQELPEGEGWRATFELEPDPGRPSDMRLYLEADGERLTETWSYVWYPRPGA